MVCDELAECLRLDPHGATDANDRDVASEQRVESRAADREHPSRLVDAQEQGPVAFRRDDNVAIQISLDDPNLEPHGAVRFDFLPTLLAVGRTDDEAPAVRLCSPE
jgi:hypothetical protein